MAGRIKFNLNISQPGEIAPTFSSQELLEAARVLNNGNIDVQLVKDLLFILLVVHFVTKV